jgi:hypothetical protein
MVARMSIMQHRCYGTHSTQLGSALDCPKCWEALELAADLYEAKQEAARVKKALDQAESPIGDSDDREDCVLDHATTADTYPMVDTGAGQQGGRWSVSCVCGWSKSGHYARDTGEVVALRLAHIWGDRHEKNPGAGE